eukprot:SAG22_NODE_373_length_11549_cov_12.592052_7_plen_365_part_00
MAEPAEPRLPGRRRLGRVAAHLRLAPAPAGGQLDPTTHQGYEAAPPAFPTPAQRAHYEEHGFVVVDDALDAGALLLPLRSAARRIRDRVQAGSLTHGFMHRTGRDFPGHALQEVWGVRGLYSAQHDEPAFAEYIGHAALARYVRGFARADAGAPLDVGQATLFVNPRDAEFTIGWHRDGNTAAASKYGKPDYSEEEERRQFQADGWPDRYPGGPRTPEARQAVGFQLALVDSDDFECVPGSHRRWRSEQEFETMSHYKGGGAGPQHGLTKYSDLPGQMAVRLKAGQTVFWDGDLIHRGSMRPARERLTLHCSMGVLRPARIGGGAAPAKKSSCDNRELDSHTRQTLSGLVPHLDDWPSIGLRSA